MKDLMGWKNTHWGMTEREIIDSVGGGVLSARDKMDYSTNYSTMVIPGRNVGGFSYDVIFQMSKSKHTLCKVLLQHELDENTDWLRPFDFAKTILDEKFGQSIRNGTSEGYSWNFPTTIIDISYLDVFSFSAISIIFSPTAEYVVENDSAF